MQRKKWRSVYIDISLFTDLTDMTEPKTLRIIIKLTWVVSKVKQGV